MTSEPVRDDPTEPDVPPIPIFNDRAIRWAVARGMAVTGAFASIFLVVLLMVLILVSGGLRLVQGDRFSQLAFDSVRAGHPEFDVSQDGSCCVTGPLFGVTNLGLASQLRLRIRPVGALNYAGDSSATVDQGASGEVSVDLGAPSTPLRDAIDRDRQDKPATGALLRALPSPVVVSAFVEFDQPLTTTAFGAFFDGNVPVQAVPIRNATVFYADPYDCQCIISWPDMDSGEFTRWAGSLRSSDRQLLDACGLPDAASIKRAAGDGHVYAFVLPRMPLSVAIALLANPAVRSLNVMDVAFDPEIRPTG